MTIQPHDINALRFAEIISNETVVTDAETALDLLGSLYYEGYDGIILHQKNLTPEFFDLRTGLAGEVLQKFSNYKMRLAILGEFEKYESKSLNDFIRESNRAGRMVFVSSLNEVASLFNI